MLRILSPLLLLAACAAPEASDSRRIEPTPSSAEAVAAAMAEMPASTAIHPSLERFLGTWNISARMIGDPSSGPVEMNSTETIEALGPWMISNMTHESPMGTFYARLAVAHDPETERYVASWIDTSGPRIWVYEGWLEDDGATLVLEAEGPAFDDPTRTTKFRDIATFTADGERDLRSLMQDADGNWVDYVEGHATRVSR